MSLTRDQLVARVRRMLYDFPAPASSTETADGVTNVWIMPDRYIDEATLKVYMTPPAGEPTDVTGSSIYSFDSDSSALAFIGPAGTPDPPDVGTVLDFTYWYYHWAEEDLVWALSDAVYSLAPTVYLQASIDITADGSRSYAISDPSGEPAMYIRDVYYSEDGETWDRLSKHRQYRIERGALDAATLVPFEVLDSGTFQVSYTMRPQPFASGTETLADLGLPERVQRALVLYSAWTLLEQRINPRMRSDIAVVTQGEGVPTPSQLLQHSARIKALLDLELDRQRMRPQTAVGI